MKILEKLFDWFDNRYIDFRLERYLSASVDLCDLEHRQQKWEFMSESERNRYHGHW
jgi:hypothetical protein